MEPKNRLFIAIAVILLMVAAMFTSFGRSLFGLNPPSVVLPHPGDGTSSSTPAGSQPDADQYQTVEVTPATVQNVIATLARSDSYYREMTVETFWEGGSSAIPLQVWTDGGWSHIRQVLSSGVVRHDVVGEGDWYYWYDGSTQYEKAPADERSSDLAQRLPTYETVLDLDSKDITAAGYELRGGLPCVYVEVRTDESGLLERYWVSVASGLLVSAETEQDGQIVYRMTAYTPVTVPCPSTAPFHLPDGTVLHTIALYH